MDECVSIPSVRLRQSVDKKSQCKCQRPNHTNENSATNSGYEWWPLIVVIRHCGPRWMSNWTLWTATINRRYGIWPTTGPSSSRRTWPLVRSSLRLKPGQFLSWSWSVDILYSFCINQSIHLSDLVKPETNELFLTLWSTLFVCVCVWVCLCWLIASEANNPRGLGISLVNVRFVYDM